MKLNAAMLLGLVHQGDVEAGARDGVDIFALPARVRQQFLFAGDRVDHPAVHRHGLREHVFVHADLAQSSDAAVRESEVDGAAGGDLLITHVAACLVHVDLDPAFSEIDREQRAREPGADDGNLRHKLTQFEHTRLMLAKRSGRQIFSTRTAVTLNSGARVNRSRVGPVA